MPIEHAWLSDLFMHDHRVRLFEFASDLQDYVESLDSRRGKHSRPSNILQHI
jgi:hypothetical protein